MWAKRLAVAAIVVLALELAPGILNPGGIQSSAFAQAPSPPRSGIEFQSADVRALQAVLGRGTPVRNP